MKGCEGQISLFDFMEPPKKEVSIVGDMPTLPCDTCGYIKQGCCDYPCTPDDYCVLGDKWIPNVKPGDWIEKEMLGSELTFDEITQLIGKLIILDKSTQNHEWYKVVMVEKIVTVEENHRRLVYYDGVKQRGLINEMYFNGTAYYKQRAWRLRADGASYYSS